MRTIRPCGDEERPAIVEIVNAAAEAYRGVIPVGCWREPYMPLQELDREIAAGVEFSGYEADGELVGVMGFQSVLDVDLIRHAYVCPDHQRQGVGSSLLGHLARSSNRRMLVGTWAAADWAVRFYRRHGFELVRPEHKAAVLKIYWALPERQIEASIVLRIRRSGRRDKPRFPFARNRAAVRWCSSRSKPLVRFVQLSRSCSVACAPASAQATARLRWVQLDLVRSRCPVSERARQERHGQRTDRALRARCVQPITSHGRPYRTAATIRSGARACTPFPSSRSGRFGRW